jgi:hypothetical protein
LSGTVAHLQLGPQFATNEFVVVARPTAKPTRDIHGPCRVRVKIVREIDTVAITAPSSTMLISKKSVATRIASSASRETELPKDDPIHVVTCRLGNSPKVAMRHYLMTTDRDFERAALSGAASPCTDSQDEESPAIHYDVSSEVAFHRIVLPHWDDTFSGVDLIIRSHL